MTINMDEMDFVFEDEAPLYNQDGANESVSNDNVEYVKVGPFNVPKERARTVLAATQIGLSPLPTSPITEFAGEFIESRFIDDEKFAESIKKGASAAGTDLAIRLVTGGLPSAIGKGLTKVALSKMPLDQAAKFSESVLMQKGLFGKLGEKASKFGLDNRKSERYSAEVVQYVLDNPELVKTGGRVLNTAPAEVVMGASKGARQLREATNTIDSLAERALTNTQAVRKNLGELVGKAKKSVGGQGIKADLTDVMNEVNALDSTFAKNFNMADDISKITGKSTAVDLNAGKAIQVIKRSLNPVNADPRDIDNLQTALDSIDASQPFLKIFEKQNVSKTLTFGESQALKLRTQLSDSLGAAVQESLEKSGDLSLIGAKQNFSKIASAMGNPEIRNGLKSPSDMKTLLTKSLREGRLSAFKQLKIIDDFLPAKDKFLDDVITKEIGDEMFKVFDKTDAINIFKSGSARVGQSLIQPSALQNQIDLPSVAFGALRTNQLAQGAVGSVAKGVGSVLGNAIGLNDSQQQPAQQNSLQGLVTPQQ